MTINTRSTETVSFFINVSFSLMEINLNEPFSLEKSGISLRCSQVRASVLWGKY